MTISLKVGICYLVAELTADALIFLCFFKSTGAIAASFLESLLYGLYYFLILVKSNSRFHLHSPLLFVSLL